METDGVWQAKSWDRHAQHAKLVDGATHLDAISLIKKEAAESGDNLDAVVVNL